MVIKIAESEDADFEQIKHKLLERPGGGGPYALNILCQKKIGDEFTVDAINNAYFLVVNLNESGEIIGFAAVMYYADDNDPDVTYLYIELICNAPGHSMGLRSNLNRAGAKAMIQSIEQLARNKGCSYVKLSAIDQVVPYYFRLGFNFKSVVGEDGEINNYLRERSADLVQDLRDGQLDDDKEAQEQSMDKIIQRFYPGYLNERYQETLSKVRRNPTGPAKEQGIPMIKWLDTGRGSPLQEALAPAPRPILGGNRQTKKRQSVPKRYIPKGLSNKDKKIQREMLKKSRKLYKKGKYYTRRKVPSFKSKKSSHITKAQKIYKIDKVYPGKKLAMKTGCTVDALKKIVKKGEGAYFSSGSRPNQTAQSWGYARLASAITSGKSAAVDYNILEKGCKMESEALRLAKKAKRKYGYGKRKTPQINL